MDTRDTRADLALDAALRTMAPLVDWLLHEGVSYPRLANALKQCFLDAAPGVLQAGSTTVNDSSVSTLTGIHRKDVRAWREGGRPLPQARTPGAVAEVFTRWANDPAYRDEQGQPRALQRVGGAGSFDALAASVSNDVHPHTLLRELIRLGVARRVDADAGGEGDKVSLCADAFVPRQGTAELLALLAANVGDHLAAATHNVKGSGAPMLEQSVFADHVGPDTVAALGSLARQIWSKAFHDLVHEATVLGGRDQGRSDADQRVRIGMYFYHGPDAKA